MREYLVIPLPADPREATAVLTSFGRDDWTVGWLYSEARQTVESEAGPVEVWARVGKTLAPRQHAVLWRFTDPILRRPSGQF